MSSVTAGGFTVFPEVGVKLKPEKGACAVWYNLKTTGEGDVRTKHASCPVLSGNKWGNYILYLFKFIINKGF